MTDDIDGRRQVKYILKSAAMTGHAAVAQNVKEGRSRYTSTWSFNRRDPARRR